MRVVQSAITTLDQYLEEAQRAKAAAEVERWRAELRPHVLRQFAARARTLTWSRALLKLVVEELYPDDLFTELVGNLDRVPSRQWPRVIAIAVALRHSWRRDGLTRVARRLRVSVATTGPSHRGASVRRSRPSASSNTFPSRCRHASITVSRRFVPPIRNGRFPYRFARIIRRSRSQSGM
jgi:hypothetical protein